MEEKKMVGEKQEESKEIEAYKPQGIIQTFEDLQNLAKVMFASGLFQDVKSVGQAVVQIMAGRELGIGPYSSMNNINIIKGKTSMSSNLMAAKVKAAEKYDYRVKHLDNEGCIITFYQLDGKGKEILLGESKFDKQDAQNADLLKKDVWRNYPRNLYFARAMSNGVRFYCPDIFYGQAVYTEEELSPDMVIEGNFTVDPEELNKLPESIKEAKPKKTTRPLAPEKLADFVAKKADGYRKDKKKASPQQRKLVVILLNERFVGDSNLRHELNKYLCGVESTKDIDDANILALLDWMKPWQDDSGQYRICKDASQEIKRIVEEVFGNGKGE